MTCVRQSCSHPWLVHAIFSLVVGVKSHEATLRGKFGLVLHVDRMGRIVGAHRHFCIWHKLFGVQIRLETSSARLSLYAVKYH